MRDVDLRALRVVSFSRAFKLSVGDNGTMFHSLSACASIVQADCERYWKLSSANYEYIVRLDS